MERSNYTMSRESISEDVKRKLYAESMGRCMNPSCQRELFRKNGDIIEKAHILPYCETADNSFENLLILCPNCHKDFDKNSLFTADEVKEWKKIRENEVNRFFQRKFETFDELKKEVAPLLLENKTIYENYYLGHNKKLWDKFELKILVNNRTIKKLFEKNFDLIQCHPKKEYSNLAYIHRFMLHIDEFETTRGEDEKNRQVLFPKIINSMFGIEPVEDFLLPSTEALEDLITKLTADGKFETIVLGIDNPYIQLIENDESSKLYLFDTPRLRQLYFDYDCSKHAKVRLESLNFALKYMKSRNVFYSFLNYNNLREVDVNGVKLVFVYEYCLSEVELLNLMPEENDVIVNLHNWNGESCISKQAYELAEKMKVTLLTMNDFYKYIYEIKKQ